MAQSNEQGDDELDNIHQDLANAFQEYALSDPRQYHDRTGAGFRLEAEHFILRAQSLMHKWERADRKQHELDARIDELHNVGGVNDSYESIGHLKAENIKTRIAELKAERSKL